MPYVSELLGLRASLYFFLVSMGPNANCCTPGAGVVLGSLGNSHILQGLPCIPVGQQTPRKLPGCTTTTSRSTASATSTTSGSCRSSCSWEQWPAFWEPSSSPRTSASPPSAPVSYPLPGPGAAWPRFAPDKGSACLLKCSLEDVNFQFSFQFEMLSIVQGVSYQVFDVLCKVL